MNVLICKISQIFEFFSSSKYCRFKQLWLVTLSNGCPKEVRNPKLSGILHRSGIRRHIGARALLGLQLGVEISLAPPRDRSHYSATFPLDVISLDLSAKLLANSQHRITTRRIPSKLNGLAEIEYLSRYAISQLRASRL